MASSNSTVAFILDQVSTAGEFRAKKMFGEYGLFCGDKMVALICDDQLYVKPCMMNLTTDSPEKPIKLSSFIGRPSQPKD